MEYLKKKEKKKKVPPGKKRAEWMCPLVVRNVVAGLNQKKKEKKKEGNFPERPEKGRSPIK